MSKTLQLSTAQFKSLVKKLVREELKNVAANKLLEMPYGMGKKKPPVSTAVIGGKTVNLEKNRNQAEQALKRFQSMSDFASSLKALPDTYHRDWVQRYTHGIIDTLQRFGVDYMKCKFAIGNKDDEVAIQLPNPKIASMLASKIPAARKNAEFGELTTWPDEVWYNGKGSLVIFWYD